LKAAVPVTGKTSNALTCGRIAETLAQRWDRAEPLDSEGKATVSQEKTNPQHDTKQPSDLYQNLIRTNPTNTSQVRKETV
jgi:hypothetical protein